MQVQPVYKRLRLLKFQKLTRNQSSDGSASSLCPSSSTSTQHTELQCSDFRSSKDYEGYGTVELFLFNPQDYPDESQRQRRFDYFVKNIVPSKFNWPAGVKEARVLSPSYVEDEGLGDEESLRKDWKDLKRTPKRVNFHSIKKLASAHKCLRGMWILIYNRCESEKRDEDWVKIAQATAEEKLGMFAKVSVDESYSKFTFVYTNNFTNKKKVMDLEGKIRDLGLKGQMSFKPSVYTILNIYANNEWYLKTGIYTSRWEPVKNSSVIQDKTK